MKEYKQVDKDRKLRVKRKNSIWVELGILVLVGLEIWESFSTEIMVIVNGFIQ